MMTGCRAPERVRLLKQASDSGLRLLALIAHQEAMCGVGGEYPES